MLYLVDYVNDVLMTSWWRRSRPNECDRSFDQVLTIGGGAAARTNATEVSTKSLQTPFGVQREPYENERETRLCGSGGTDGDQNGPLIFFNLRYIKGEIRGNN